MYQLEDNEDIYQKLKDSWIKNYGDNSTYWKEYVSLIASTIEKKGLKDFGTNRSLSIGFGDARKTAKSLKIRKYLKFPFLYKILEYLLTIYRYRKNRLVLNKRKKILWKSITEKLIFLSNKVNPKTKDLRINRCIKVNGLVLPWRYLASSLYLELIQNIISKYDSNLNLNNFLDGNFLDIGGGYGVMCETVNIFKELFDIRNTKSYVLEQFPVSYICRQYLDYNSNKNVEIISQEYEFKNKDSSLGVIQSCKKNITGLNISFFFNSNSFQEMDDFIIENYVEFIKNNCSIKSYLGVFLYDSKKNKSEVYVGPERVNNILEKHFFLIGSLSSKKLSVINNTRFNKNFVMGTLFIYKVQ